jgi:hypothetical protein
MNQGMVKFYDSGAPTPEPDRSTSQIHVLTVQGHPEFTTGIVKEIIKVRRAGGAMDRDTAESGLVRADERNDGHSIGGVIWEVLLQNPRRLGA